MSGTNPFRRNEAKTASTHGDRDGRFVPPIDTDAAVKSKVKTGKTVRIVSPHSAASDVDDRQDGQDSITRISSQDSPTSPDVLAQELADQDELDPFTESTDAVGNRLKYTVDIPKGPSEHGGTNPTIPVTSSNPFLKSRDEGTASERSFPSTTTSRAQLDVDGFKELLLTGQNATTSATTDMPRVTFRADLQTHKREQATDTRDIAASQSRTVRASISTDSDEAGSNECQVETNTRHHESDSSKPNTPKHHYGKRLQTFSPRVVSFDDPDLTFSDAAPRVIESSGQTPPPGDRAAEHGQQQGFSTESNRKDKESKGSSEASTNHAISQRKLPPAPPPSRRHGPGRPRSFIADIQQTTPTTKQLEQPQAEPAPQTSTKPAPPPPRRHGSTRSDSRSSVPTLASQTSSPDPYFASTSMTTSSSMNSPSSTAAKRQSTLPPSTPPLPPPRRRGSSHSSQNPTRFGDEYRSATAQRARGDSGASSISQVQIPPPVGAALGGVGHESAAAREQQPAGADHDPLADLSALQREVDEYRERIGK